jgi:asparagine synthetase B (glutamine-hydrolysing)
VYVFDFSSSHALTLHPWQSISNHEIYQQQIDALQLFLNIEVIISEILEPDWLKPTTSAKVSNQLLEYPVNFTKSFPKQPDYKFFEVCQGVSQTNSSDLFDFITEIPEITETIKCTIALLTNSIRDRIQNTPKLCRTCVESKTLTTCKHARIGLLFSGGLDCSILARITDQLLDKTVPIDLMNVAFEKVCRQTKNKDDKIINWDVPDRLTARESLTELQRLSPNREWRLVEINVTREELNDQLTNHISHLVYPLETVLDESIGAALWFAARGKGCVDGVIHQSVCRVMLIGSGADELFGGYTRHRNAYTRNNKTGDEPNLRLLEEELALDWVRLPTRNLARDDRIISDHGCTARSPFVEEKFTNFIRNLRSDQKCCHALDAGIGDKLLLRLCAHRLGLGTVCTFKKRALQFGTRIADRKQNAKDRSDAL